MPFRHLTTALALVLAASPIAVAFPPLSSEPPGIQNAIRIGVLRFRTALHHGGMAGVTVDVQNCYRPIDHPGEDFQFLVCLSEDDAGYDFSVGAFVYKHFPPLPFYRRSTFFARQNEMVARSAVVPPKLRTNFIKGGLNFVGEEMQVVMGPPNQQ